MFSGMKSPVVHFRTTTKDVLRDKTSLSPLVAKMLKFLLLSVYSVMTISNCHPLPFPTVSPGGEA